MDKNQDKSSQSKDKEKSMEVDGKGNEAENNRGRDVSERRVEDKAAVLGDINGSEKKRQ